MFASLSGAVRTYLRKHPFVVNILIAVWTLVQSMFQLTCLLIGHYLYNCVIRPKSYDAVLVYLTYFYREKCGGISVEDTETFMFETNWFWLLPIGNRTELYGFLKDVLSKGILPKIVAPALRTNTYLQISIIFESFWIFASVILLIGACFKVKDHWTILFSGPWLLITGLNIILDITGAVHYGLDIRLLYSYTDWLRFIGVENYKDFGKYNSMSGSSFFPMLPSIIFILFTTRIVFTWVLNILCLAKIFNRFVVSIENRKSVVRRGRTTRLTLQNGQEVDLNSSEARIRNWQLFYGANDSNSTLNSTCSSEAETNKIPGTGDNAVVPSISQNYRPIKDRIDKVRIVKFPNENDFNGKTMFKWEPSSSTLKNNVFLDSDLIDLDAGRPSVDSTFSLYYCKFSDPNYPNETAPASSKTTSVLRSQLPWSYLEPKDVKIIDSNRKHSFPVAEASTDV